MDTDIELASTVAMTIYTSRWILVRLSRKIDSDGKGSEALATGLGYTSRAERLREE